MKASLKKVRTKVHKQSKARTGTQKPAAKKGPKLSVKKTQAKPSSRSLKNYLREVPHFIWKDREREVLAIGTAHVSARSVQDVRSVFELYQPNTLAVELCPPRLEALMLPHRWKNLDIAQVIKQKKMWLLVSSLILSAFQKKIGKDTGALPGMEMKTAVQLAKKHRRELILADREVRITLTRAWAKIGFFSRFWLGSFLLSSLFLSDKISEEDIEKLKKSDVLEDMLHALPKRYAPLRKVILEERDLCIAEYIRRHLQNPHSSSSKTVKKKSSQSTKPKRVLAVLGAAHLKGVERNLKKKKVLDIEEALRMPRPRILKNIFSWIIFALFFFGISALFFQSGLDSAVLQELLWAWVLSRSIGAGVGALLAYPSPAAFLVTVLLAPISYFLGFVGIRLGMASALTELRYHKPQVEDFENIAKDIKDLRTFIKSLYKNRVVHLIFLIFSVSWGLTIGNLFFFKIILRGILNLF